MPKHAVDPVDRVYAEALMQAAQARGRIEELGVQLAQLVLLVQSDVDLQVFLGSPAIDEEDKKRVLETALRGRADDLLVDFVSVVIDKRRIAALPGIAQAYADLADRAAGRQRVRAASAVPLPERLRAQLEALLRQKTQREPVLEAEVRPELLGGLVLTIGDRVYDGSVSGRLRRLREEMRKSSGYED